MGQMSQKQKYHTTQGKMVLKENAGHIGKNSGNIVTLYAGLVIATGLWKK